MGRINARKRVTSAKRGLSDLAPEKLSRGVPVVVSGNRGDNPPGMQVAIGLNGVERNAIGG
jgi:hypothetical protein